MLIQEVKSVPIAQLPQTLEVSPLPKLPDSLSHYHWMFSLRTPQRIPLKEKSTLEYRHITKIATTKLFPHTPPTFLVDTMDLCQIGTFPKCKVVFFIALAVGKAQVHSQVSQDVVALEHCCPKLIVNISSKRISLQLNTYIVKRYLGLASWSSKMLSSRSRELAHPINALQLSSTGT